MKKLIALFCCAIMLATPAMADGRDDYNNISGTGGNTGNYEYCKANPDKCQGGSKKHASKNSNTTKIVVISVAAGAVFAGAMWYIFKKKPSENNPGQVKFVEF